MLIFLAGLQSIPEELYEAARIDGAGRVAVFLKVTLPLLTPVIMFQLIFSLIRAAQVVADGADVLGAQAELRAGDHGAGHLAAGAEVFFMERHLAGVGRKVGNDEQSIGGVEAHANHVEFRHVRDIVRYSRCYSISLLTSA